MTLRFFMLIESVTFLHFLNPVDANDGSGVPFDKPLPCGKTQGKQKAVFHWTVFKPAGFKPVHTKTALLIVCFFLCMAAKMRLERTVCLPGFLVHPINRHCIASERSSFWLSWVHLVHHWCRWISGVQSSACCWQEVFFGTPCLGCSRELVSCTSNK